MLLAGLSTELTMEVIHQTPPHHLYNLMQTNKRFHELCLSDKYWAYVVLHLGWETTGWKQLVPRDMVLLRKSYRATMEGVVQNIRNDLQCWGYPPEQVFGSVGALVRMGSSGEEPMYQLAKKQVTDQPNLSFAIRRATRGGDIPVAQGFISAKRRGERARTKFLRSLENDPGMDLSTKERVRAYAVQLFHDICDRRIGNITIHQSPPSITCELFEEDVDAHCIFLEY
jgi:hypothetical protein